MLSTVAGKGVTTFASQAQSDGCKRSNVVDRFDHWFLRQIQTNGLQYICRMSSRRSKRTAPRDDAESTEGFSHYPEEFPVALSHTLFPSSGTLDGVFGELVRTLLNKMTCCD